MSFDFERDVVEASRQIPVMVDFWAEWCGPCRVLGPALENVTKEMDGRVRLVKVNVDEQPALAQRFRISSIPKVILFSDGQALADFVGALPEREIRRFLEAELPTPSARALNAAKQAIAGGKPDEAERLLADVAIDPKAHEARVLLGTLRFPKTDVTELLRHVPDTDAAYERAAALLTLSDLLARSPTLAAENDDGQRYAEAARALGEARYDAALETWRDLLRRRKKLDDDGPRRMMLALFQVLGEAHPLTTEYRRKFASALF